MRKFLPFMVALFVAVTLPAGAQDRAGAFVSVDTGHPLGHVWLNTREIHTVVPCRNNDLTVYACIQMDDHQSSYNPKTFRTVALYPQAVRHVLNLPNPTTPSGSISGLATATVGEPVTLTATVVDPDFGDSWTYSWAESSATRNGGSFSDTVGMVTDYTPARAGTVVLWFQITDSAGQRSSSISHQIEVSAAE